MLDSSTLKTMLKNDLVALYEDCNSGNGISDEDFADQMATTMVKIMTYIKDNAKVSPGTGWQAGPYTITGGSTGTVQ
jgi:hypothetical protein